MSTDITDGVPIFEKFRSESGIEPLGAQSITSCVAVASPEVARS